MHYKPETVKTSSGEDSSESDTDYSYTKYQMSKCTEKYYIEDDEWDVMPCQLNQGKAGVALCKFQNRYLYAFGGDNGATKGNIVSDIERLDLYEEEEVTKWDLIYIKQKEVTSPFAYAIALPIDDARILIVGGRQNLVTSGKTYVYNGEEDSLKPFSKS